MGVAADNLLDGEEIKRGTALAHKSGDPENEPIVTSIKDGFVYMSRPDSGPCKMSLEDVKREYLIVDQMEEMDMVGLEEYKEPEVQ